MKLAGCMTVKSILNLAFFNSFTIICNTDKGDSTFFDFDSNSSCSSINSVFNQFFYDAGWAFNDFTGRNLVYGFFAQYLYFCPVDLLFLVGGSLGRGFCIHAVTIALLSARSGT